MSMSIREKFTGLGIDAAPGQEVQRNDATSNEEKIPGTPVDFSHGDVDAFLPTPGSFEAFEAAVQEGGSQAYTEYRGRSDIREDLAVKLSAFTGKKVSPNEVILTPGTQGALFLAMGACVAHGDKVAIVEPDYFANRKLVVFLEGVLLPVPLNYLGNTNRAGIDLDALEKAFKDGARVFLFSSPNNPTGVIYSKEELGEIGKLARHHGVTVLADELYARQIFDGRPYNHLCAMQEAPEEIVTVIGPSKTESLSGYRLGVAFGNSAIIDRMEKLQAIVSLRCSGYAQAVFRCWFNEPDNWLADRVRQHQAIRDDLVQLLRSVNGVDVRQPEGGSYLFVCFPKMKIQMKEYVHLLRTVAGVTVTHGTEFGPGFEDWFRINFSQNHTAAVDALKRAITLMERYRV